MSAELSVVIGLAFVSIITFAYAIVLKGNAQPVNQGLSMFFAFLSLVFVNVILFSIYQIAANSSLTYLSDFVLLRSVEVIMWITILLSVLYFFNMLFFSIKEGMKWGKGAGNRGRSDGDE